MIFPELGDILNTLNLPKDGTKAMMIQHIEDYFKYHPEQKESDHFSGLFTRRPRRPAVQASISAENDPPAAQPHIQPPAPTEIMARPSQLPPSPRYHPYYHPQPPAPPFRFPVAGPLVQIHQNHPPQYVVTNYLP